MVGKGDFNLFSRMINFFKVILPNKHNQEKINSYAKDNFLFQLINV